MKTGKHLKIKSMGTDVLGVKLEGNPNKPEPTHFRITLPFGDVDIARCSDDTYWIHIRINKKDTGMYIPGELTGKFIDARIDITSKHANECNVGDFEHPDMYHMAVRMGPVILKRKEMAK